MPLKLTELNNDGMIELGDVHYQTEPNLSILPRDLITNDSSFWSLIFSAIDLQFRIFPFQKLFVKCPLMSVFVCKQHFYVIRYDVISTE